MSLSFKPLRPLLQTGTSSGSRWFSYIGLGIGVLLLLCSVQMFININQLVNGSSARRDGYDFISITKTVTNETMGQPEKNLFTPGEVEELKKQAFVDNTQPLLANDFRVKLSGGNMIPFSTDLFLESIDNEFIDTIPPSFNWSPGQETIPVIISSDFLEIWNVFAPSYDLPQISQRTAGLFPLYITCEGRGRREVFQGRIVAFSDRVNSILVPRSFLDWANGTFSEKASQGASRLFIKTKDANDPRLLNYLDAQNYKVNKDKTKFGRVKQTLQGIFGGLGIFGLLVVVMALMLFSFYLQLVIARSRDSLQLLLLLGYSPGWLSKKVSRQFIPVYVLIVLAALLVTQAMQFAFHRQVMYDREELTTAVHPSVPLLSLCLIALAAFTNYRLVRRLLHKMF